MKSRLSKSLRKSRRNRGQWASQLTRSRGLRVETLEDRRLLTVAAGWESLGPAESAAEGEATTPNYIPGQLLVEFLPGLTTTARNQLLNQQGAKLLQTYYGLNWALIELPLSAISSPINGVVSQWEALPQIVDAEPNYVLAKPELIPNDQFFVFEWGLNNTGQTGGFPDADIDMVEAWNIFTGSPNTVVAVLDTGVDYLHADLRNNMWRNPGEIPDDDIDNDGNGYVDDIYGIAPAMGATNVDPMDTIGHGTHVAGTIGAQGDNTIGVAGVNWDVQIMAINMLEGPAAGTGAVLAGISYVTMMRERYNVNVVVSNNSWGWDPGTPPLASVYDAIERHIEADILFVASAGNDTNNNDALHHYPSDFDLDGIISVAATSQLDLIASYSNFGQNSVDLAAPGGDGTDGDIDVILSTWPATVDPFSQYHSIQGTSMASPHVAGVVALVRGLAPEMSVLEVKDLILDTVDPLPSLQGLVGSGGRLNAFNALSHVFSSEVEGTVWSDINGNTVREIGEPGLSNWTVYIDLNNNGQLDGTEPSDVTDENGDYSVATFAAPGTYTLREIVPPHWTPTNPASGTHRITFVARGDVITDKDFGNKPSPGVVRGVKWNDLDGDGIRDPNEPGMAGIYIYADMNNDGMIALGEPAAITGADGSYVINGIPAGEVSIREVLNPGWEITYPLLGYHVVDVVPAQTVANINFGNASSIDYGDAPAPYATLKANSGASHGVLPGFQLGALVDGETDGRPSLTAAGDDVDNLEDEDGVIISGPMFAGGTSSVDVIVQTSGYPRGYLNAWIDFNGDGDWSDAGEQIATSLRLAEGTHTISFPVPLTAEVGGTFARFRYGLERELGPTGPASAGEVEDHAVLVLKDEPVANADSFEVEQDSINNTLDVLDNDFPSSTGTLTITAVTQPDNGTVAIGPSGQSVLFTPNFGIFSPPVETFTYTISDGTGKTSTASVSVYVRPQLVAPQAVDDIFRVTPGSGANQLLVLANDLSGVLGTVQLTSVTAPGSGTATINNNGTADPLDDYIAYTPNGSFASLDQFQYTISNANGSSTATVTIQATPAPANITTDFNITFENLSGEAISEINLGDEFYMVVTVQDLRTGLDEADAGIFAAYMDLLYDRGLVLPVFDASNALGIDIAFSASYPNFAPDANAQTPGLIDEVGAFQFFATPLEGLGTGPVELFRAVFTANAVGTAEFKADPADESPAHDTVYFSPIEAVDPADISYGISSLVIVDPNASGDGTGEGEDLDVNADGSISPIDVLMVISHLNDAGAHPTSTGGANPRFDVNRDNRISPMDALLIISYLNHGGEGEGEGEFVSMAATGDSGTTQADLLSDLPLVVSGLISTTPTAASPAAKASVTPAAPQLPLASQDWRLQIGQSAAPASSQVDVDEVLSQHWESLLDTLAEDVLEAWLDGEDA